MEEELNIDLDLGLKPPLFLGFFLQPDIVGRRYTGNGDPPSATFLHGSQHGKRLLDGEWGSFDDSLSFLDMPDVQIVGSSNGLLLCCPDFSRQNLRYVVCNPVTREFTVLPQPHNVYKDVCLTFICKRNDDRASLDRINYEILRVGIPVKWENSTTFEIETFSSLTWEWNRSPLISALPFSLTWTNKPGVVLDDDDDVIYWRDPLEALVVYDRSKADDQENIQVVKFPKDGNEMSITMNDRLGSCEGKVYYVRRTGECDFEVWFLSDYKRAEWILKYKVNIAEIVRNNPNYPIEMERFIGYLHPYKSHLMFVDASRRYYWYDFKSGKLQEIGRKPEYCYHFVYEWPCVPSSSDGGCQSSRL